MLSSYRMGPADSGRGLCDMDLLDGFQSNMLHILDFLNFEKPTSRRFKSFVFVKVFATYIFHQHHSSTLEQPVKPTKETSVKTYVGDS